MVIKANGGNVVGAKTDKYINGTEQRIKKYTHTYIDNLFYTKFHRQCNRGRIEKIIF